MYLYQTITDKDKMQDGGMFMPVFKQADIDKADRMEVWASSFKDAGEDYNIFKLMLGNDTITERRMGGC